ncbi:MAG TPA: hypothetical protein PK388_00835 [Kiritimatiellia bacterium]|nr:hypothetical protein [Kiritimatiellia bacterium]
MNLIRTIAAWTAAGGCSLAAAQTETAVFQFGARTYSAAILDESRADVERRFPELGRPPDVGDAFAYRVANDAGPAREIAAAVVATDVLECAAGPEIAIHPGELRLDLLRALYLTDILHHSPQILEDPRPPLPPAPDFDPQIPPNRTDFRAP